MVEALFVSSTEDREVAEGGTGSEREIGRKGKVKSKVKSNARSRATQDQEQRPRTGVSALHELSGLAGPSLFRRCAWDDTMAGRGREWWACRGGPFR